MTRTHMAYLALFPVLHLVAGSSALGASLASPVGSIALPFIIGSPGRSDSEHDRREARRYASSDSAVAPYADVDVVADATWLQHEIESYARRSFACDRLGAASCRRERRLVGRAWVLYVASGSRAELLWVAGRRAIRLGWRRIIEAPTGTMTVETPPQRFATALLTEFPSSLAATPLDDAAWAAAEADRRRYYAELDRVRAGENLDVWCSADGAAERGNAETRVDGER